MHATSMSELSTTPTRRLMMSVTVNRPAVRAYLEWRHLARAQAAVTQPVRFRPAIPQPETIRVPWIAATGTLSAGEAELALEVPGALIAWASRPVRGLVQAGEVWFSPLAADRSEVCLMLTWQSESADRDRVNDAGETAEQMQHELSRFKYLMEH